MQSLSHGAAVIGPDRGQAGDLVIEMSAMIFGVLWDQRSDEVWGYASATRTAEKAKKGSRGLALAVARLLACADSLVQGRVQPSAAACSRNSGVAMTSPPISRDMVSLILADMGSPSPA